MQAEASVSETLTGMGAIPAEAKALHQWVLWRYEQRGDKMTKVPYQVNGEKAELNNPDTWTTFDLVSARMQRPGYDGIGVTFGNGLAGIDMDDQIDGQGQLSSFARRVIEQVDSYTELSPSGEGIHILFWGKLPPGGRRKDDLGIEMYSAGRFFTVTGSRLEGSSPSVNPRTAEVSALHREIFGEYKQPEPRKPSEPTNLDDAALLDKAHSAANGSKFSALWSGSCNDYSGDHSRADLALCSSLAFWTGGDTGRMDSLFRQSGLMREKWDVIHSGTGATYGEMTIERSLQGVDFYKPLPSGGKSNNLQEPEFPEDWPGEPPGEEIVTTTASEQPAQSAADRFTLHTAADALQPQPPIDWIVENLFSAELPS